MNILELPWYFLWPLGAIAYSFIGGCVAAFFSWLMAREKTKKTKKDKKQSGPLPEPKLGGPLADPIEQLKEMFEDAKAKDTATAQDKGKGCVLMLVFMFWPIVIFVGIPASIAFVLLKPSSKK